jgi:hypothetical protein
MEEITLQVLVGNAVDESYDVEAEESSTLLPEELPDDGVGRRQVQFTRKDVCDSCSFDECQAMDERCKHALSTITLENGHVIDLPRTFSDEFLAEDVMSFGRKGAIVNLIYEDSDDGILYEEHDGPEGN